jgi:hypothetical protein
VPYCDFAEAKHIVFPARIVHAIWDRVATVAILPFARATEIWALACDSPKTRTAAYQEGAASIKTSGSVLPNWA